MMDEIPKGSLFDIIVCSHVLEHVNEPGKFLRQLRSLLSVNGVIYIEVPLEIWKGIPIQSDPVTHINFFTVNSLRNALLLHGFTALSIKNELSSYGEKYKRVAWAVAAATEEEANLNNINSLQTKSLLQPKATEKLVRYLEDFRLNAILNLPLKIKNRKKILQSAFKKSSKPAGDGKPAYKAAP